MDQSTEISQCLANQGLKIRIRKDNRRDKRRISSKRSIEDNNSNTNDDDDQSQLSFPSPSLSFKRPLAPLPIRASNIPLTTTNNNNFNHQLINQPSTIISNQLSSPQPMEICRPPPIYSPTTTSSSNFNSFPFNKRYPSLSVSSTNSNNQYSRSFMSSTPPPFRLFSTPTSTPAPSPSPPILSSPSSNQINFQSSSNNQQSNQNQQNQQPRIQLPPIRDLIQPQSPPFNPLNRPPKQR